MMALLGLFCLCGLSVFAQTPGITNNPVGGERVQGDTYTFAVLGTNFTGCSWQWYYNGTLMDLAKPTNTLALPNIGWTNAGSYQAVATKAGISITSAVAVLSVVPASGVSYDFNTPGQLTNNFNARGGKNTLDGQLYPGGAAVWGEAETGGIDNSRSLSAYATTNVNTLTAWKQPFSFGSTGAVINASVMFKYKAPTVQLASNQLMYLGFIGGTNALTTTSANSATNAVFGVGGFGPFYIASRLYSVNTATGTNSNLQIEYKDGVSLTFRAGPTAPVLTEGNWYRLTLTMTNARVSTRLVALKTVLENVGPNGLDTPSPVLTLNTNFTTGASDTFVTNRLYFAFSPVDYIGVDKIDNAAAWLMDGAPVINTPLMPQTVLQNRSVTFTAAFKGAAPCSFQWIKDGTEIPGATGASYTIARAATTDAGAYSVRISNASGNVTSDSALLTVTADTQEPALVSAGSVDGKHVGVRFDEVVSAASAQDVARYSVSGATVTAATLRANGQEVDLTLASPISGSFTVTVSGVQDLAGNAMSSSQQSTGTVLGLTAWDIAGADGVAPKTVGSSFSSQNGGVSMKAGGVDFGGTADDGHLLTAARSGDFDIKVQVQSFNRANLWNPIPGGDELAVAGLVARAGTNANSQAVQMVFTPFDYGLPAGANVSELGYRNNAGAMMTNVAPNSTLLSNNIAYPQWLRLRKVNTTVTGYRSLDGVTWNQLSSFMDPALSFNMLVGLGASAHQNPEATDQPVSVEFNGFGEITMPDAILNSIDLSPATAVLQVPSTFTMTSVVSVAGVAIKEVQYVWQRTNTAVVDGWTNIPTASATSSNLVSALFTVNDELNYSSWAFRCIARVGGVSVTSSVTRVIGFSDTNAAYITDAQVPVGSASNIFVYLSRAVTAESLTNTANYIITNSLGSIIPIIDIKVLNNGPTNASVMMTLGGNVMAAFGSLSIVGGGFVDLAMPPNTATWKAKAFTVPSTPGVLLRVFKSSGSGTSDPKALTNFSKYLNNTPDSSAIQDCMAFTGASENNEGAVVSTTLVAPSNGQYKVWLRCDDGGMIRMNTNGPDPRGAVTIAYRQNWVDGKYGANSAKAPSGDANNQGIGAPIYLEAGKQYYLEAMFQNNSGGDLVGAALRAYTDTNIPPDTESICSPLAQPVLVGPVTLGGVIPSVGSASGVTVEEDTVVTFTATNLGGYGPYNQRWLVNGVSQDTFVDQSKASIRMKAGDTNLTLQISNSWSAASVSIPLTVLLETNAPVALSAYGNGLSRFYIATSTRLDPTTVTNVSNYSIPGVTVLNASLYLRTNIILKTTPQAQGTTYAITLNNVNGAGALHLALPLTTLQAKSMVLAPGLLNREFYTNIAGAAMSDLTNNASYINHQPDLVDSTDIAATPDKFGTNYGAVISGYLVVPVTTNYTFFMANNDVGELNISTDEGFENLQGKLTNNSVVNPANNSTKSTVKLSNGVYYYFQAKVKQAGGDDVLRISVRTPEAAQNIAVTNPIPSAMLVAPAFADSAVVPQLGIVTNPTNTVAVENQYAAFYVAATNTGNWKMGYFWQKYDAIGAVWTNVPGAFGTEFHPYVTWADEGARFRAGATLPGKIVYSDSATVHVTADQACPGIASATGHALPNALVVTFTEAVDPLTATNAANYTLAATNGAVYGGLNMVSATLVDPGLAKPTVVLLRTAGNIPSDIYRLTVNNVTDLAHVPNAVCGGSVSSSSFSAPWLTFGTNMAVSVWTNLAHSFSFTALTNMSRYPYQPDYVTNLNITDWTQATYTNATNPTIIAWDFYGAQMKGTIIPPVSGNYAFYINADDSAKLIVGPGGSPTLTNLMIDAEGAGCAACNSTASYSANAIYLSAGMPYNFEDLFIEYDQGDYSHMQWMLPGATSWSYISSNNLYGFSINPDIVDLAPLTQVSNTTLLEGRQAVFCVSFDSKGLGQVSYQWQQYNTSSGLWEDIAGQTNQCLDLGFAGVELSGGQYRAKGWMSALNGAIVRTNYSVAGTLTVTPDTEPPHIVSVGSLSGDSIGVVFSEPIRMDSDFLFPLNWLVFDTNISANLYDVDGFETYLQYAVLSVAAWPDPNTNYSDKFVLTLPSYVDWASKYVTGWEMPYVHGQFEVWCLYAPDISLHTNDYGSGNNLGNYASSSMTNTVIGLTHVDIGTPLPAGVVFAGDSTKMHVSVGGRDFYNNGDEGAFIETPITGDFDVRVQVNNVPVPPLTPPDVWSKAVLMARGAILGTDGIETNSALGQATNSLMTYIGCTATNAGAQRKYETLARYTDLASAYDYSANYQTVRTYPAQLRMTREILPVTTPLVTNSIITTYYWDYVTNVVTDTGSGLTTTNVQEQWIVHTVLTTTNWPEQLYVGPAVTSHSPGNKVTALFQDFKVIGAPVIDVQPVGVSVAEGAPVSLSVTASGPAEANQLRYQWRQDGVNVTGATNSTLTIPSSAARNSGLYTVVVRNSAGAVVSAGVNVLVTGAPWVAVQPANQTAMCNGTATFTVTAGTSTPADPITYQWRLGGNNLQGENGPTLTVNNASPEKAGPYSVVVGNSHGSAISSNAFIILDDTAAPTITCPANMTVECGTPAVFTAAAQNSCGAVVPVTCSPQSGAVLPVGTHTVTCTSSNASSAAATSSFTVTVVDTVAPVIACPANITTTNTVVSWPAVTASDACAGSVAVTCLPTSGSTFSPGTTTVNCQATDGFNTSHCSFTVTVGTGVEEIRLSVVPQTEGVLVSWPTTPAGYTLQYSLSLGMTPAAQWHNYAGPFTTNGTTISTSVGLTNSAMFFKLSK